MPDKQPLCKLCGEPMPEGEEMFKYHGFSGPCPKPPKPDTSRDTLKNKVAEIIWRAQPAQPDGLGKATELAEQIISLVERTLEAQS